MSQDDSPPTGGEQPRTITFFNLLWHLMLVAATCAGFGLGMAAFHDRQGRVVIGFVFAILAHFATLAVHGAFARWMAHATARGDR